MNGCAGESGGGRGVGGADSQNVDSNSTLFKATVNVSSGFLLATGPESIGSVPGRVWLVLPVMWSWSLL